MMSNFSLSMGLRLFDPMAFFSLRHEGLHEVSADGAACAHEGVDREIAITTEHRSDAGRPDAHALGELGAVDPFALHELQELFDHHELSHLYLGFDGLH